MKLCKECENQINTYAPYLIYANRYIHCHHEEEKKELVGGCVYCVGGPEIICIHKGIKEYGLTARKAKHCPECGRKL